MLATLHEGAIAAVSLVGGHWVAHLFEYSPDKNILTCISDLKPISRGEKVLCAEEHDFIALRSVFNERCGIASIFCVVRENSTIHAGSLNVCSSELDVFASWKCIQHLRSEIQATIVDGPRFAIWEGTRITLCRVNDCYLGSKNLQNGITQPIVSHLDCRQALPHKLRSIQQNLTITGCLFINRGTVSTQQDRSSIKEKTMPHYLLCLSYLSSEENTHTLSMKIYEPDFEDAEPELQLIEDAQASTMSCVTSLGNGLQGTILRALEGGQVLQSDLHLKWTTMRFNTRGCVKSCYSALLEKRQQVVVAFHEDSVEIVDGDGRAVEFSGVAIALPWDWRMNGCTQVLVVVDSPKSIDDKKCSLSSFVIVDTVRDVLEEPKPIVYRSVRSTKEDNGQRTDKESKKRKSDGKNLGKKSDRAKKHKVVTGQSTSAAQKLPSSEHIQGIIDTLTTRKLKGEAQLSAIVAELSTKASMLVHMRTTASKLLYSNQDYVPTRLRSLNFGNDVKWVTIPSPGSDSGLVPAAETLKQRSSEFDLNPLSIGVAIAEFHPLCERMHILVTFRNTSSQKCYLRNVLCFPLSHLHSWCAQGSNELFACEAGQEANVLLHVDICKMAREDTHISLMIQFDLMDCQRETSSPREILKLLEVPKQCGTLSQITWFKEILGLYTQDVLLISPSERLEHLSAWLKGLETSSSCPRIEIVNVAAHTIAHCRLLASSKRQLEWLSHWLKNQLLKETIVVPFQLGQRDLLLLNLAVHALLSETQLLTRVVNAISDVGTSWKQEARHIIEARQKADWRIGDMMYPLS